MDPLSQGICGAVLSQSAAKPKEIRRAGVIGFISALLPDADILIRSAETPIVGFYYHRHFTHSLTFIPIGALLASALLFVFFRKKMSFKKIYFYSFLGFATHGFLDTCTSYGTLLLWPFSNARIAWDIISIIDPVFTGLLGLLILVSFFKRSPQWARAAICYSFLYMGLGLLQHERATNIVYELADSRGHSVERLRVMPTLGNLSLWRAIYESNNLFYADGIRVGIEPKIFEGSSIKKFNLKESFPNLKESSQQAQDIKTFSWFSDGFIVAHPNQERIITDFRYARLPNSTKSSWGILVNPEAPNSRVGRAPINRGFTNRNEFFKMLFD